MEPRKTVLGSRVIFLQAEKSLFWEPLARQRKLQTLVCWIRDKSNENCRISFIPWAMGSVDHSSRAGAEISW
jgi:hypothetical protein